MRSWTSLIPPKLTRSNRHIYCLITFVLFCITCISTGIGVGYGLKVKNFDGSDDDGSVIRTVVLGADLISVDPDASTMTMDWFILFDNCAGNSTCPPVSIYFDNNLLQIGDDSSNVNQTNQIQEDPIFTWYPNEENSDYFTSPVFRSKSLLFNSVRKSDQNEDSTLQDYPFDVGFKASSDGGLSGLSDTAYANTITLQRSGLIKTYVLTIVIGVWLVTLTFVGSTMKVIFRFEQPKEVFAIPIATLFAFTTLRTTMPGAPPGFGAIIGLLPCLAIITVTSVVLLAYMVISNGKDEKSGRRAAPTALDFYVKTYDDPETAVEKPQDTATTPYIKDTGSGRSDNSFLSNTTLNT
ncbi:hypothetical protein BDQ17DRAFT_1434178 [Cyathus striatus]|nr:hypothetical protein BDQ17DRAFT_1434178 [Cyathus striatus]